MLLEQSTKTGKTKKGTALTREKFVTVSKTDPLENVVVKMESLFSEKKLLPSKDCFKEHWQRDPGFKDSVCWSFKFDAGGNSMKGIMGPNNVEDPNSQRHVLPILEFGGGVKDTDHNMRTACFGEDDFVRTGIEAIVHRRCILLKVVIGGKLQVLLVKNSSATHDQGAPKALPMNMSGSKEYTQTQPATKEPMAFDKRMVEVDVDAVTSMKLLVDTTTKSIDGLCFVDSVYTVIGQAFFQIPIKNSSSQPVIEQYLMVGMFTADLEFLSKFLGHQGASAKYLCMFCLACKHQLKNVFLHPDERTSFEKRTFSMLTEDGKRYNEMMSKYTEKEKEKNRPVVTKNHTHSVVGTPMANVSPDGSCSPGTMHVILGITPWMVKVTRRVHRRREELESEALGRNRAPA